MSSKGRGVRLEERRRWLKELENRAAVAVAAAEGAPPDSPRQEISLDRQCRRLCCPLYVCCSESEHSLGSILSLGCASCADCPISHLPSVSHSRHALLAARGTLIVSLRLASSRAQLKALAPQHRALCLLKFGPTLLGLSFLITSAIAWTVLPLSAFVTFAAQGSLFPRAASS